MLTVYHLKALTLYLLMLHNLTKKTLLKYLIYFIILKLTPIIQFSFKFPLLISLYTWNHLPFRIKFKPCFDYIFSPLRLNNLSNIYQCICILLFYNNIKKSAKQFKYMNKTTQNSNNKWIINESKLLLIILFRYLTFLCYFCINFITWHYTCLYT